MNDLIERDALYKAVCRLWNKSDSEDFEKGVFEIIKDAPTINVVRCKDCKYFEFDSWAKVNEIPIIVAHEICKFWGSGCGCKTDSDGYCSFGERKEDE